LIFASDKAAYRELKKKLKIDKRLKTPKKMRLNEHKFELKKKKNDARARIIIRSTIDLKAFGSSLYDCKTASEMWNKLKPSRACTEEELQRLIAHVRLEYCLQDTDLIDKLYEIVNKSSQSVPDKKGMYEAQAIAAALLNLKARQHKFRFLRFDKSHEDTRNETNCDSVCRAV